MKASKHKRMKRGAAYLVMMLFLLLLFAFVSAASAASAEDIFPVNISGSGGGGGQDIAGSINNFYKVALGLGGIAAVAVIVVGALYYTTSGAIDKKNLGKGLITSAIWGLVLLLGAFIVLNTINPELVSLKNPPGIKNPEGEKYEFGTGSLIEGGLGAAASCRQYPDTDECEDNETPDTDEDDNLILYNESGDVVGVGGSPSCCVLLPGQCPEKKYEDCEREVVLSSSRDVCRRRAGSVKSLEEGDKVWQWPYYMTPEEGEEDDDLDDYSDIMGPENAECVPYAYQEEGKKIKDINVENMFNYLYYENPTESRRGACLWFKKLMKARCE